MIEPWDAEELAGILLGLEDAKSDLLAAFRSRQEGDSTKYAQELVDAATRWDELSDRLADWPGKRVSDTLLQSGPLADRKV